jgi:hypothetical protein
MARKEEENVDSKQILNTTGIIADDMSHEKKNTKEKEKKPLPIK